MAQEPEEDTIMDETTGRKPATSRRRLTLWALFGTVGLIMGAAYATGFASTNNTTTETNAGSATQLLGTPAVVNPSQYAAMVAATTPLAVTFDGNYGVIAAATNMFTIDLTHTDPYGHALVGTYYADVVLSNWSALGLDVGGTGPAQWDTLEFKFKGVQCDGVFSAFAPPGANGPTNPTAQMHVDRVDAHVTFTGLAAGHKFCFGLDPANATTEAAALQAASGGSIADTVMFRPNAAPTATLPAAPQFAVTLNRSA
jgi:hypothetical protein